MPSPIDAIATSATQVRGAARPVSLPRGVRMAAQVRASELDAMEVKRVGERLAWRRPRAQGQPLRPRRGVAFLGAPLTSVNRISKFSVLTDAQGL